MSRHRLFQRGLTWWVDYRADDGSRYRVSTETRDKAQAARKAVDIVARLDLGITTEMTLEQAVKRTIETRWKGTAGERTATFNVNEAIAYFGAHAALSTITTSRLDDYVRWLTEKGNANATINRKLAALSAVLRDAMDRDQLSRLPKFPRQRESQGRIRWLTEEEEATLLGLLHRLSKDDEARLVQFLVDTGCRLGEALRLQWTDLSEGQAHLWETKSGEPRTVALTTRASAALEGQRHRSVGPWAHLTKDSFRHTWDRAREMMNLGEDEQFIPHALRHTCASRLVQRGVPLAVVQAMLGHKVIQTTMRYAHLAPANLAAAVAVLEPGSPAQLRRVK